MATPFSPRVLLRAEQSDGEVALIESTVPVERVGPRIGER
jgi:hypothetical protein